MLSEGTKIPYYNDKGTHKYRQAEISDGFTTECKQLFAIPEDRIADFGTKRPKWDGEKYVPEDEKFIMKFTLQKVKDIRCRIVNGKSVGHYDKVNGELLKYAGNFDKSCELLIGRL